jgi:hypothetical protein
MVHLYTNQHKFVHYLHLAGVRFKFFRCPFQIMQVSISNFAGVHFKFCRCSFQILQVSIFKFCRCTFQILQVSFSNFAGVHFTFCRCPFQIWPKITTQITLKLPPNYPAPLITPQLPVAIKGNGCDSTTWRHRREKKGMWHQWHLSRKIALFLI